MNFTRRGLSAGRPRRRLVSTRGVSVERVSEEKPWRSLSASRSATRARTPVFRCSRMRSAPFISLESEGVGEWGVGSGEWKADKVKSSQARE